MLCRVWWLLGVSWSSHCKSSRTVKGFREVRVSQVRFNISLTTRSTMSGVGCTPCKHRSLNPQLISNADTPALECMGI